MVDELIQQLPEKPKAIILSVGGGGLLAGVVQGLKESNEGIWKDVPVIAMETIGADSLYQSVLANGLVTLPAITSIAKSLGAKQVAKKAFECTQTHSII